MDEDHPSFRPNLMANLEPSAETNPQRCVSALGAVPLGLLTVDVAPSAWGIEYSGINMKRKQRFGAKILFFGVLWSQRERCVVSTYI